MEVQGPLETLVGVEAVAPLDIAAVLAVVEATVVEEALEEALEGTAVEEAQVDGPQAPEDIAVEVVLEEALEDTAAEEAMEEEVDLSGYKEDWMFREEFDSTV